MFGKPEWFKETQVGWGLIPISWRGRVYVAIWLVVILFPFLLLFQQGLGLESLVWLGASLFAVVVDARWILREMKGMQNTDEVLYIDGNETVSEQLATREFDFRLRR